MNMNNKHKSQCLTNKLNLNYMLTSKKLSLLVKKKEINVSRNKKEYIHKSNKRHFISGYDDKLFWIFYILENGFEKYELIGSNHYQIERDAKFKLIDKIKEKKQILKEHKFKKIKEMCDDLINLKEITIKIFHALCIIHNISFIYIENNIFYEYKTETNELPENLIFKINEIFGYEKNCNIDIINNYKEVKMETSDYEKPLKSSNTYKMDDIALMAKKFNINMLDGNKKKTKNDLYNELYRLIYNEEK